MKVYVSFSATSLLVLSKHFDFNEKKNAKNNIPFINIVAGKIN